MIAYLNGKITHLEPAQAICDVGGVGYLLKITLQTYLALQQGHQGPVLTWMQVKEDGHTLYGFTQASEKNMFLHLISVNGIGPGTAITLLSSLDAVGVEQAILAEDVRTIQAVKGIGPKTAQRIILELKDKIAKGTAANPVQGISTVSHNTVRQEALTALTVLGIARPVAEKSIDTVLKAKGKDISLEELIKMALKTN